MLEWRCIGVDRQCRESEGKAKIKGYMSISDEEAHHRELRPEVVAESDEVLVHYRSRTNV